MKTVFVDASYDIAIPIPRDQSAVTARRVAHDRLQQTVTMALVVTDVCNTLSSLRYRRSACRVVETLHSTVQADLIDPDESLWKRPLDLYAARPDKSWSLTDGRSFVVMRDRGISEAITSDRPFGQAGFTVLLK